MNYGRSSDRPIEKVRTEMRYEKRVEYFDLSETDTDNPMYEKLKQLNEKKIVQTIHVVEIDDPEYEAMKENYEIERMKEERRNLNESEI